MRWRTGPDGRTLYITTSNGDSGQLVGMMDTPALAAQVTAAVNAQLTGQPQHTRLAQFAQTLTELPAMARSHREAAGLTIRAAADQAGVSPSTLHRLIQGRDISMASALAIAAWLDTPPGGHQ